MLEKLFFIHNNVVKNTPLKFKRYLFEKVNWKERAICVTGARGVGKTTLLLQYYHEQYADVEKCLYLSADNVEVAALGLFEVASEYFKWGGQALIVDEIHKYPSWPVELKNLIDTFKDKQILVSGSSSLDLKKGKVDLSRRAAYYDLKGLSFREYLELKEGLSHKPVTLQNLLKSHVGVAQHVSKQRPVLKSFQNYIRSGFYPYFLEGESSYFQKLLNVIEKVLYEDVSTLGHMKTDNLPALKKILWMIASSPPFLTNIERMSRDLSLSKPYVYHYIEYLERAGLIQGVKPQARGFKLVRKPAKLLMDNTNLLIALNGELKSEAEKGTLRETFFANQIQAVSKLSLARKGDFVVGGTTTFEVGGKNKKTDQIQGLKNAYLALDGIDIGANQKIPLYLFGFLY